MKTFISLFLSSGAFAAAISIVYWFSSKDITGTLFLGLMMLAFAWVAVYTKIAEAQSDLAGDKPETTHAQRAGEDVGIVTKATPWPLLLALCILMLLFGIVWSSFVLFLGLGGMLLCLWRLGAESARTGTKRILTKEGEETVT